MNPLKDSFLNTNFDESQSIKLNQQGELQKTQAPNKTILGLRKVLNIVSFGLVNVNPKLDKAVRAIAESVNQNPEGFAQDPDLGNKMKSLRTMAKQLGVSKSVRNKLEESAVKLLNVKVSTKNLGKSVDDYLQLNEKYYSHYQDLDQKLTLCEGKLRELSSKQKQGLTPEESAQLEQLKEEKKLLNAEFQELEKLRDNLGDVKKKLQKEELPAMLDQDIICFQEVHEENANVLNFFKEHGYEVIRPDDIKTDSAIVINKNKFEKIENFSFGETAIATAVDKVTGKKMVFISSHLMGFHLENKEKMKEGAALGDRDLQLIMDYIDQNCSDCDMVVFGSDMNASPDIYEARFSPLKNQGYTSYSTGETTALTTNPRFAKDLKERKLDYIHVKTSDKLKIHNLEVTIQPTASGEQLLPIASSSDHLRVGVEIGTKFTVVDPKLVKENSSALNVDAYNHAEVELNANTPEQYSNLRSQIVGIGTGIQNKQLFIEKYKEFAEQLIQLNRVNQEANRDSITFESFLEDVTDRLAELNIQIADLEKAKGRNYEKKAGALKADMSKILDAIQNNRDIIKS